MQKHASTMVWLIQICALGDQCPSNTHSLSQAQICPENFKCCHTETKVADQTGCFTNSLCWNQANQSKHWPYTVIVPDAWYSGREVIMEPDIN